MSTEPETPVSAPPFEFTVTPAEVDAGAELTLEASFPDLSPEALENRDLVIFDADGNEVARTGIDSGDDEAPASATCTARVPLEPGDYRWRAVLASVEDEAAGDAGPDAEAAFTVTAHSISVIVWQVPPAVVQGGEFRIRVGLKCSADCGSQGWAFAVRDHQGREVTEATVGDEPWSGTAGLYHAEVALTAPKTEGAFTWTVAARRPEHACPHREAEAAFVVRAQPAPEFRLRVEVKDAETGAAVAGARVVAHPYRGFTDADGVAELMVPRGNYTIFVSGKKYFASKTEGEVNADVTIRAEMHVDREFGDADAWS